MLEQHMSSFRIDRDSLGQVEVPYDAYYGPFTTRAKEQYKVTGHKAASKSYQGICHDKKVRGTSK